MGKSLRIASLAPIDVHLCFGVRFGVGTMKALLEPVFLVTILISVLPVTPTVFTAEDCTVFVCADFLLLFRCVC